MQAEDGAVGIGAGPDGSGPEGTDDEHLPKDLEDKLKGLVVGTSTLGGGPNSATGDAGVTTANAVNVLSSGGGDMGSQQLSDLITAHMKGAWTRHVQAGPSGGRDVRLGLFDTEESAQQAAQLMAGPILAGVSTEVPSPVAGTRAYLGSTDLAGQVVPVAAIQAAKGKVFVEVSESGDGASVDSLAAIMQAQLDQL
jgi:hypothetical protein